MFGLFLSEESGQGDDVGVDLLSHGVTRRIAVRGSHGDGARRIIRGNL